MNTKSNSAPGRLAATGYALLAAAWLSAPASAATLAVNQVNQLHPDPNGNQIGNNWCWAASSKMVLDFYGHPESLETIAAYGVGNSTYDTWNYLWGTGSESRTNIQVWENTAGTWENKLKTINISYNGIEEILKNFSSDEVQTQRYGSALTAAEITTEIDDRSAPFVTRIGWAGGGGHFMVCYGTAAGTHSIRDPWFGSYLIADAALRTGTTIDGTATHTWTHTLTTSKIVDVLFLFDSTGSMGDDIANAKANASALLDSISTRFKNFRVAVADYKDFPEDPYGDPSDYTFNARQPFTTNKAAAQAAINSLSASGGNDWPESVYTALSKSINGDGIGAWRDNPARRIIILIGDAPGHDPEPWAGGTSFNAVLGLATNPAKPVAVHCLLVGSDIDAQSQYDLIAGGSGGGFVQVSGAGGVSLALQGIIDSVASTSRKPSGNYGSIFPTFTFEPEGQGGMGGDAQSLLIEVQRKVEDEWTRYSLTTLKNKNATIFSVKKPFPTGDYRWRVGFKRKAAKLYLPSSDTVSKVAAATVFENDWTEFSRVSSPPGNVNLLSPSQFFTAGEASQVFEFGAVPGATSYVLQLRQGSNVVKTYKIKAPTSGGDIIRKTIGGLKSGEFYNWRVQGLNYDRPAVDDTAW